MITRDEALTANTFHCGDCTRTVGPRGGVTIHQEVWRRTGQTHLWKTRPDEFRVPVKYGMGSTKSQNWYVDNDTAARFHTADNCPLNHAFPVQAEIGG